MRLCAPLARTTRTDLWLGVLMRRFAPSEDEHASARESGSVARNRPEWKRGIRIGSAKDGKVIAFIPDPNENATGTSAAEGVAVDSHGNVYGAEVGPRALKKYVMK